MQSFDRDTLARYFGQITEIYRLIFDTVGVFEPAQFGQTAQQWRLTAFETSRKFLHAAHAFALAFHAFASEAIADAEAFVFVGAASGFF